MTAPKRITPSPKVVRAGTWIPKTALVSVAAVGLLAATANACASSATQAFGPPAPAPTASTAAAMAATASPLGSAAPDVAQPDPLAGARASDLAFSPPASSAEGPFKKERTDLLAKTALIYPKNLPLTASVLSEWMSCDVILLYLKAGYSKAQVTQAESSLDAAQRQAQTDLDDARQGERQWVDDHLPRDVRPHAYEVMSARIPMFRPPPMLEPLHDPNRLPPEQNPPETLEVHPYQVERTMLEVAYRVSWVDILQHWPGGCPPASHPETKE